MLFACSLLFPKLSKNLRYFLSVPYIEQYETILSDSDASDSAAEVLRPAPKRHKNGTQPMLGGCDQLPPM